MRIAYVGLGTMGGRMVDRLLTAGHEVRVYDRSRALVDTFAARGARPAASAAEAADGADAVLACVMTPEQVRDVFLGPGGAIERVAPRRLHIDLSTIVPEVSRDVGAALAARGARFLDAPVSGGPKGAEEGTLSIMVGGAPEDYAAARPILATLGSRLFHMGPIGAGIMTKLCNNMATAVQHVMAAEALVLGAKAGLDPQALYDVMSASSGQSTALTRAAGYILERRFSPAGFPTEGIIKDVQCALDAARALGVRTALAPVAQQLFIEAASLGYAREDISAVIKPMEAIAGVEVGRRTS